MTALLLQVLFEAGLMLPLDLCVVGGAVERVILMSAGGTEGWTAAAAPAVGRRRRRAGAGQGFRDTRLRSLLRVLLVRDGGVVVVRRTVEGLGRLVLLLDGLVDRVLGLVRGLPGRERRRRGGGARGGGGRAKAARARGRVFDRGPVSASAGRLGRPSWGGRRAHLDALGVGLVGFGEVVDGVVEVLLVGAGLFGDALLDGADVWVVGEGVGLGSKERHRGRRQAGVGTAVSAGSRGVGRGRG